MKKHRLFMCLAAAAIYLVTASAVVAAEAPVLQRIVKTGELRIGMSGDQAPLNMKDRSGKRMGLEVDLAMLLAAAFDAELRVVEKPFPDLLAALKAGEVDLVMSGVSITAARTVDATFVGPYVMSGKSIVTKSQTLAEAQDASDLNAGAPKLAALENSTSQRFVEKRLPKAQLTTTRDYDAAVKMLLEGQVDAMVADMPVCQLTVLRYPQQDLVTLAQPLTVEPIGIAISPDDPQLKNLLENYLGAIEGMGLLEILRAKWFEDGSWVAALP